MSHWDEQIRNAAMKSLGVSNLNNITDNQVYIIDAGNKEFSRLKNHFDHTFLGLDQQIEKLTIQNQFLDIELNMAKRLKEVEKQKNSPQFY